MLQILVVHDQSKFGVCKISYLLAYQTAKILEINQQEILFTRYFIVDAEIMQECIGGMELNQLIATILELTAIILELIATTILELIVVKYKKSTTI